ncbi:MAG: tRNA (adenosine(37)-N6)-threonylcarbamoyltransferase complex ATPase subunit type 1 TsaE [Pseudomonadota bacterium]
MTSNNNSCVLADEEATLAFGACLAAALGDGGIITLRGDLGTGKTTFSRGLLRALGHKGAVKSPTYTLVEPYEIGARKIFHYDLYRLNDPAELEYLGLRDFIDDQTLTLIEWPEKGAPLLPPADLDLTLCVEGKGRRITWQAFTHYGEKLAGALAAFAATQDRKA